MDGFDLNNHYADVGYGMCGTVVIVCRCQGGPPDSLRSGATSDETENELEPITGEYHSLREHNHHGDAVFPDCHPKVSSGIIQRA